MAVSDDLNRLAAQDVVYLMRNTFGGGIASAREVFRGRLRQSLDGEWIFTTFMGQNGVVGFILGGTNANWASSESPAGGIQVVISTVVLPGNPGLIETIILMSVIPAQFTE